MAKRGLIQEVAAESPNRRSFVRKLGLASAVVGAAATPKFASAQTSTGPSDVDILNFALNIEYLDADFFTIATTGMTVDQAGIDISGSGTLGDVTGGSQVAFTDPIVMAIATELAKDEQSHIILLRKAIFSAGGTPIARPAINLNALGFGFGSQNDFLVLARIFEDIGVTAYGGAAPLIQNKDILGYTARILATEAEHVGSIRTLIAMNNITTYNAQLDGADVLPPPSGTHFFSTDFNGITLTRSPGQVLYLAYNGPNKTSGGFFPSGVNGSSSLNTSSAAPATSDNPISASPNPIVNPSGGFGQTTISWNAMGATSVEIHVGSPTGPLFAAGSPTGSMQTGMWVTDGMEFFLQDTSNGAASAANTIGTVIVKFAPI
jgi:hypothetical protein